MKPDPDHGWQCDDEHVFAVMRALRALAKARGFDHAGIVVRDDGRAEVECWDRHKCAGVARYDFDADERPKRVPFYATRGSKEAADG